MHLWIYKIKDSKIRRCIEYVKMRTVSKALIDETNLRLDSISWWLFTYPAFTTDAYVIGTTLARSGIIRRRLELGVYEVFIDAVQFAWIDRRIVDGIRGPVMFAIGQDVLIVKYTALHLAKRRFLIVTGLQNKTLSFFIKEIRSLLFLFLSCNENGMMHQQKTSKVE